MYPCQPLATSMILVSLCSPCGEKHCESTDEAPALQFTSTSHAQLYAPNTSIIFTSEFNITPWEITQLQLSHDGSYRDTGLQEHAVTGLLASKNVGGGYTEKKCLKLMWIVTTGKAAAPQTVKAISAFCLEYSVLLLNYYSLFINIK